LVRCLIKCCDLRKAAEVKSLWSVCAGLHTCYKGRVKERQRFNPEHCSNVYPSTDYLLKLEGMKPKSLVIVDY